MSISVIRGTDPSGSLRTVAVTEEGLLRVSGSGGGGSGGSIETLTLTPTLYALQLNTPNTESSVTLTNIRLLEIFCRSNVEVRYAFSAGVVAASTNPYRTIPAGVSQPINLPAFTTWSGTIYLASSAIAIVELEAWGA